MGGEKHYTHTHIQREKEYYAIGVNGSYFACAFACLQMEINK